MKSEFSNVLQRPSSGRTQDISHILARTFGDKFLKDPVDPLILQNLRVTSDGSNDFQKKYASELIEICDERQRRLDMCITLEQSIKQAKTKAISADQKQKNINNDMEKMSDLGLPTTHSLFRSCLNNELLYSNGLLCGYDLGSRQKSLAPIPTPRDVNRQTITRNTSASVARSFISRNTESSGAAAELNAIRDLDDESSHINPGSEDDSEDNFPSALQPASPTGFRQQNSKSMMAAASGASGGHRGSAFPREDSRQKRLRKVEEKKNRLWKEHADAENRAEARKMLTHMQNFVNYKPNPSFIKPNAEGGTGILINNIKDLKPGEEIDVFVPKPNVVLFTEYEIGKVYELTLELRNISCACRYLRIIPPKTKYFSVSLGLFPGIDGSVAPGLACHYKIRFSPDSVGDFDDEIVVESQSEKNLIVPLKAHRPAPNLTLPDVIDIGQCLLLGYKISKINVKNTGGKGKFAIIPRSAWPCTNFKMIVNPDIVTLPPFHLRPAVMELDKDQSCILEVVFSPIDEQVYKTEFSLICDNCQVKHFCLTGEGERANVQIVSVENGTSSAYPGESSDVSASALIRFDDIHPFTLKSRTVRIRNSTNVELPFVWKLVKPHCVPPNFDHSVTTQIAPSLRIIDMDAPFSMEPAMGLLAARAELDFELKFAPTEVAQYHCALHMVLQNIPDINNSHMIGGACQKQSAASVTLIDVTALEIEIKGDVKPLDVRVEPAAVALAGQILVGTTVRRQIKMLNCSDCPVTFCWEGQASGHILEVEPRMGMIDAGQFGFVELCVTGHVACKLERTLLCHIENSDTPVALQVYAEIKGQEIIIDQPDLSFGLVRLNESCVRTLSLRNANQILTRWRLIFPHNNCQYFSASQELGELRPLEKIDVDITFTPQEEFQNMKQIIEVAVENGSSVFANVVAEVQRPCVCLLKCQVEMKALYQCVESIYTCEMYNQTELPTAFSWLPAQGQDAAACQVSVRPSVGVLRAREQLTVQIVLTCKIEGEISDLMLPCEVDGLDKKLLLQLYGTCYGLSVIYSTPSAEENSSSGDVVSVDFGSVQVHSMTKRVLRMHNTTAIKAKYSIQVDYFRASAEDYVLPDSTSITLEQNVAEAKDLSDTNAIRLKKRPNLADPSSKPQKYAFYDMCKTMLQEKKGAAFHCKPSHGELQAFETLDVEITAFTDMWGHYEDFLIVRVDHLEKQLVPLHLQVEGSPIEFTMNAGRSEQKPVVRFGTHSRGAKSVTRPIRLNNKSPFAVRLDWEVYNSTQSPSKLLDLITSFGRVFPLLDGNGAEILPELSKPQLPPVRMPTEMLPNSPDSSVAVSHRNYADDVFEYTPTNTDRDTIISKQESIKDLQIITLNVRPHEGFLATSPFSVSPTQLVIPPESYEYVHVTFNPHYNEDADEKLLQFNSFACAFLSVEESATFVPNKVVRKQAYEIDPMRLEFTGRLEIPELVVEYDEDDDKRFVFDVPLSKLIANEATMDVLPSTVIYAKAVIRNEKETPLRFTIQVNSPFQLHDSTKTAVTSTRFQSERKVELAPRQSCPLKVGFELTREYLQHNAADVVSDKAGNVSRYDDAIALLFNNGSRQLLPLLATVYYPKLELSKEQLNFGTCFVGQTRELQLQILNRSGSASLWTARVEKKSVSCMEKTFVLSPAKGYLQAAVTHVSKNKTQLSVFFTPTHSDYYECVVVFNGVLGEEPQRLLLSGQGSYDGGFETIYDI